MGQITIDLIAELRKENPRVRTIELQIFADALRMYTEAAANIREHGSIVMHPRTGAPIENPYLHIQRSTGETLAKMRSIVSNRAVALLAEL